MKIALLGYGIEAESAYRHFKKTFPDAEFVVYDNNESPKKPLPEGVLFQGGTKSFHDIDADLVVRTPAINPERITTRGTVTSVTQEFFAACPVPIIGVTGTKGKGTTSSLIAAMLKKAGVRVWLVGNIGIPALDVLDEIIAAGGGVVVYELSSFQLWDMHKSPHVGVVLMIEPEHLDVHGDFENYVAAKASIATHQNESDIIVYNPRYERSRGIAELSPGKRVPYGSEDVSNEVIILDGEPLVAKSDVGLKGHHNIENIYAALAAASEFTNDRSALAAAIREFTGLPHRIEEVGKRDGVLYVNDSFSSAPPATLAAVRAYVEPVVLIMGGYDRGIDLGPLVDELVATKNLEHVVLIGQTAERLHSHFAEHGFGNSSIAPDLAEAFERARQLVPAGGVVLLSPGCASFDMFKDFSERGDAFRSLVAGVQREFVFERYEFDDVTLTASFHYSFDGFDAFVEQVVFDAATEYDKDALRRALFLAFIVIGTSYCKVYPRSRVRFAEGGPDEWQAEFLNTVYQEGMSQYAYENDLTRSDLARFAASAEGSEGGVEYGGEGILSLQSGGKDSLLTATSLTKVGIEYKSLYIASRGKHYPRFIDGLPGGLHVAERLVDIESLKKHADSGGLSGHIPVTFVVMAISLVQAVLLNKKTVLASIGHEGEEPHEWVGDLAITHQWSKTWKAEQLFAEYVARYVSKDIRIGSPLRKHTELRIAELFIENAWDDFGHSFSSCNVANYKQGSDNSTLSWCGNCPKCANSYLLFAPFLPAEELRSVFGGQDLFAKPNLEHTFKGLLGIDGVMKPFECVGEIDELRYAYGLAEARGGYARLPFDVPPASFDYLQQYPAQDWAAKLF